MKEFFANSIAIKEQFFIETLATLYMVGVTALISGILGTALGVMLLVTGEGGLLENRSLYHILDKIVNFFRSVPFIILLAIIAPFTRWIVGTTIGNHAAIVPLTAGTLPFFARQVQNALLEVDKGIIEAARSMGSSPAEIIFKVYLREGLPGIIRAGSVTIISLIGLSAMAGAIGAGGIGKLAITQGYNQFHQDVTLLSTLIILILVFISQMIGDWIVKKISH
ncbi:MAG: methionine ABC transporter permease [Peptostreptococcaceae bacterium]|nr:methionine ABC transporter permease [Peptostreptococcaceae bacterium]